MENIKYTKGDATNPIVQGNKIIVHVVNNLGKWGSGFVLAVSRHWPDVRKKYIDWHSSGKDFKLGEVLFVRVEPNIFIANMVGQNGIRSASNPTPVRYDAIESGLLKVKDFAIANNASVHAPRFGAGLAGGKWKEIEKLINKCLCENNVPVTIYDL